MSESPQQTITRMLSELTDEDGGCAVESLLPLVYGELRTMARRYLGDERIAHTLEPTALVHEAYMRLVDQDNVEWRNRRQFFVVAARAMRNILVDHARRRDRAKRGGGWERVPLDGLPESGRGQSQVDLLAVDEALDRLAGLDERKARLVELRFFAGMTSEEAADVLEISRSTASDEWRMARAWLYRELEG